MKVYYSEKDRLQFPRTVLTFTQFKAYIQKGEDKEGEYLYGEIQDIVVDKELDPSNCRVSSPNMLTIPGYVFKKRIPADLHNFHRHRGLFERDLYQEYLQKAAWEK